MWVERGDRRNGGLWPRAPFGRREAWEESKPRKDVPGFSHAAIGEMG